ncbi:hypothetical protein PG997_004447 [Apiospora hydei]|uniref:Uncharacterized protein n=1 Tax=Apiospora hydei TaxID=1337664 RepID=A0ABR1X263_9PEZI
MPGLTLNTDGTGIPQTPVPVPVPNIAGYAPPTTNNSAATTARKSAAGCDDTRRQSRTEHCAFIAAAPTREPNHTSARPGSVPPPRQSHAYSSHPAQTVVAPPPPEPIEFDTNPDVLALKSAITILQMQSNNAKKDMVALQKAKDAALEDPDAFIADLESGGVRMAGDTAGAGRPVSSSSSSSSSGADDDTQIKDENGETTTKRRSKPWSALPAAQNVYRCPPINWSQYAVTGESLDRLHNEQLARPSQGAPATVAPDGRYEFKGAGKQEEVVGVAAPYNPLRDKIERKKPKGPPR